MLLRERAINLGKRVLYSSTFTVFHSLGKEQEQKVLAHNTLRYLKNTETLCQQCHTALSYISYEYDRPPHFKEFTS